MADSSVAFVADIEPGDETQFCPIRNLPIKRGQRVRTLPGYHLLSLSAGREAVARGFYDAFGERFECTDLEYLHTDDRIFICAEDHKAFKNQMSMQYHRYIQHELNERKGERKRLRERYYERQARSLAHAARQQQPATASKPATTKTAREPASDPRVMAPASSSAGVEAAEAGLGTTREAALGTDVATDDPYALAPDPEPAAASQAASEIGAVATSSAVPAPLASASSSAKKPIPVASDDDDLYGDMEPDTKKQKSASEYTNAIGAMMGDDFDEDE